MDALMCVIAILGIILFPILTGFLFALIVGGPIYLLMKGFEYTMYFAINPIIAGIREIPFIGKLLCFIITLCVGVVLIGLVLCFIAIPMIVILSHAIGFGTI
jgi:hypothetical protein